MLILDSLTFVVAGFNTVPRCLSVRKVRPGLVVKIQRKSVNSIGSSDHVPPNGRLQVEVAVARPRQRAEQVSLISTNSLQKSESTLPLYSLILFGHFDLEPWFLYDQICSLKTGQIPQKRKANQKCATSIFRLSRDIFCREDLSDVTLTCRGGTPFSAHKMILAAASTYFRNFFMEVRGKM